METSLRDQIAMTALPGIIIAYRRYAEKQACQPGNGSVNDIYAAIAYATADACIKRSQNPYPPRTTETSDRPPPPPPTILWGRPPTRPPSRSFTDWLFNRPPVTGTKESE